MEESPMLGDIRASFRLVVLSLLSCCVLYPLLLWGVALLPPLHGKAAGSLIHDAHGKPIGSRRLGQPFTEGRYFWPRPSHAGKGYDAAASGASNWGANNPELRRRVVERLGMLLNYGPRGPRPGQPIRPDLEAWHRQAGLPGKPDFERWREAHPDVDLAPVPADLVTGSGSGLDPDITLDGALYQVPRVAAAWTDRLVQEGKVPDDSARRAVVQDRIRHALDELLQRRASAPLGGLVGVPLVNVLEVNLALPAAVADAIR
jgi:K+-transporting ATPase ATPase C chain